MGDLLRFNKAGWVIAGLGMAWGVWRAVSHGDAGDPGASEARMSIFLIFGSLSIGAGLLVSVLSNEVENEVLWKRIAAAMAVIVVTVAVALALSLSVIFTGI